jgi:DNA primase
MNIVSINELKSYVNILDVVSDYVFDIQKIGKDYKCICPFHNEKTPSFIISPEKNLYNCFGCGESGDAFTFVMKHENCSFIEASKIIARYYNLELDIKVSKTNELKKIYYRINELAMNYFHDSLIEDYKEAINYLKDRALHLSIPTQKIGYCDNNSDGLYLYLKNHGIEDKYIFNSDILYKKNDYIYSKFHDRIIFPIRDKNKNVIAFIGRTIDENTQPKYLHSKDTIFFRKSEMFYNIESANLKDYVIITEGNIDTLKIKQKSDFNVVSCLGTKISDYQLKYIKKHYEKVYLIFDSDKAGKTAMFNLVDLFYKYGISLYIVDLGEGLDPDNYIDKYGIDLLKIKIFNESISGIQFKINSYLSKYDVKDSNQKIEFIKKVMNFGNKLDKFYQQEILHILSKLLNLNNEDLNYYAFKNTSKNTSNLNVSNASNTKTLRNEKELNLISILLYYEESINFLDSIKENLFKNLEFRKIFDIMKENLEEKLKIDDISFILDKDLKKEIFKFETNEPISNEIFKLIYQLKLMNIDEQINELRVENQETKIKFDINKLQLLDLYKERERIVKLIG